MREANGMALTTGMKLGSYEIRAAIGAGGMGEVYRAHDAKLNRDVAIKILPDEFSNDPERITRFQREAETLAALNHQNIAGIYDLQQTGAIRFLILEFIEGDTLADILNKRGALSLDEALNIAKQICDALEAAHDKGIVHRDLKPANIKVMADGKVKVLDFGLAKAMDPAAANATLSNSPTLTMAATATGVILGTASYMSPEQARGRTVDHRSDIFAFGSVLYEILTGRPAFEGQDTTEILGRVVTAEPAWNRLPANVPLRVREVLRLCLRKDVKKRRQTAADVRIDIEEALAEPAAPSPAVAPARGVWLVWIVSAIAAVLIVALAVAAWRLRDTPSPPEVRLQINTPSTQAPLQFALSPDGTRLVFVASGDGPQRLWLRPLNRTDAQPLAGTEGAEYPFWSPDNRSIGFFASGKLYRIDIGGGAPQALANAPAGRGGAWNADGTIVFAPGTNTPLFRVPASGGVDVAVMKLGRGQISHRFPQFLPNGRHFLFVSLGSEEGAYGIFSGSLDGGDAKRITSEFWPPAAAYVRPDLLVFMREDVLLAQRLNTKRWELMGDPVPVAQPVGADNDRKGLSVSADGRLAYRPGGTQLVWFDRTGKVLGAASQPDTVFLGQPELSPDGRRAAVSRRVQGNLDIWLMDFDRGGLSRFTFDEEHDWGPVWSPDGTRIAFTRGGGLYVKSLTGAAMEESLLRTPSNKMVQDWSNDGRFLLYYETGPKTGADLWALDMTGPERKPRLVTNTMFDERSGQFSPDGRWVAYETNESSRVEVMVQSFPQPTGKWQVSTGGGFQPRWRADGKELYFIAPDGKLMAVPIAVRGSTVEAGKPSALFQTRVLDGINPFKPQYAVSRDGRFLINMPALEAAPITLVLNWKPPVK
jgi:Tol biopolymer transport system component